MFKKITLNLELPSNSSGCIIGHDNRIIHPRCILIGTNASSQEAGDIIFNTSSEINNEPTLRISEEGHIYIKGKKITRKKNSQFHQELKHILIEAFQTRS